MQGVFPTLLFASSAPVRIVRIVGPGSHRRSGDTCSAVDDGVVVIPREVGYRGHEALFGFGGAGAGVEVHVGDLLAPRCEP
jgi:hypothetical protein